jgi:hypothetical protein
MSDVVSGGDIDAIAAEYVLGTLDADERAHAQSLLSADEAFLAKVKVWERRFGELHLMVEPVEPDRQIWERIKGKMPEVGPDPDRKHPEPTAGEPGQPAASVAASEIPMASLEPPVAGPEATPGAVPAVPASGVAARDPGVAAKPASAPATAGTAAATPIPPAPAASAVLERRLGRWRALAVLMTAVVVAIAALLGLWSFAPKQVPTALQPVEVMRRMGVELTTLPSAQPPPRRAPPASQFDE